MFKFGFSESGVEKDSNNEESATQLSWFPASEIAPNDEQIEKDCSTDDHTELHVCDKNIKIIRSENLILALNSDDHENILRAESQHSDLLPAIYEGGLKIWECSYDLGKYLMESGVDLKGKIILDLGCGAGVLGILTLLGGATVHFQDYNVEVIKLLTIPNVLLNLEERQDIRKKCEFYCGDWKSFTELSMRKYPKEEDKYDIILTSETIYNPVNQTKLYEVFKERLRPDGVGYIAGKTHYFGVGGGMRQFEALVREEKLFDVENVWKSTEGLQREIIKLSRHGKT